MSVTPPPKKKPVPPPGRKVPVKDAVRTANEKFGPALKKLSK